MRRLAACLALLLASTCATLEKAQERLGIRIKDPRRQVSGTTACDNLLKRTVPFEEEHDVGGVLALALAQKGGGLALAPLEPDGGVARPDDSLDDQRTLAVAEVGLTLAAYSERPELPWTFVVLDSPVVNAFSAPGGYVLVTRGLLDTVESESMLAGVLAHEIAHVTRRHALTVYNTTKAAQCYADKSLAASLGTVRIGGNNGGRARSGALVSGADLQKTLMDKVLDPFIDAVVARGFSPGDEHDADEQAVDLLVLAGYRPHEYQRFVATLPTAKGVWPNHPRPLERAARVDRRIRTEWAGFDTSPPVLPVDPRLQPPKRAAWR